MKDTHSFTIINGTSALKPDCSRYSNENEHIIDFRDVAMRNRIIVPREDSIPRENDSLRAAARERLKRRLERSQTINELRYGSYRGTPVTEDLPKWKIAVVASAYSFVSLALIMVGI